MSLRAGIRPGLAILGIDLHGVWLIARAILDGKARRDSITSNQKRKTR